MVLSFPHISREGQVMLKRLYPLLIVVVTVTAALVPSGHVHGQGTFGSLPDPISSRDLEAYAERLNLSDQQLIALASDHAAYLDEFRELRDGEIEQFLNDVRVLARNFDLSKRREVERLVRTFNRLMTRVRALDERLFDSMQNVMTEQQAERLPRVRLKRERIRYSGEMVRGVAYLNPAVRVDLSEIINDLELPPDVLASVDPTLETYERRLTVGVRDVFESTTNMILETLKRLEAKGFTSGTPSDPRVALELFEAFQSIWGELSADLLDDAADVAALHRTTYRAISGVLPHDALRAVRDAYYNGAYPEAASIGRRAQREFDVALLHEDVPEDLHGMIADMADSHWRSQNRIADQVIELLEDRRRNISIREIVRPREDERQDRIEELRSRAQIADEAALELLYEVLGEELALAVQRAPAPQSVPQRVTTARSSTLSEPAEPVIGRLPSRISTRDLSAWADRLELDDGEFAVLESVYEDYLSAFRALADSHLTPLRLAAQDMMSQNPRTAVRTTSDLDAQSVQRAFRLHREAMKQIIELENSFFDDAQLVVGSHLHHEFERIRQMRVRQAYSGESAPSVPWARTSDELPVDLSKLIEELRLTGALDEVAEQTLKEYEQQATEMFQEKYFADLDAQELVQLMSASENTREQRNRVSSATSHAGQAASAITQLNRRTLRELTTTLSAHDAMQLEHLYRRRAFPDVFRDEYSAEPLITTAMQLTELGDHQRTRLRDIAMEYRSSYAEITERMVAVHEHRVTLDGSRLSRQQRREASNDLERLRFERNEINQRTVRELRSVLNEDQLRRVGGQ